MKWLTRILSFLVGFASLWGVVFLVLTTYGWDKVWTHVVGPADMGAVVFEDLSKGPLPNQALMCPDGVCNDADRDRKSAVYKLDVEALKTAFLNRLEVENSLTRVDDRSDPLSLRFVQRSRLLRFPDTVRIRFFALGAQRSTLAVYSQSQIGQSDLGVNLERIDRWTARLRELEE